MTSVYLLWHVHEAADDDAKLLGVFESREMAKRYIDVARTLPGFRDLPEGFTVDEYTLNEPSWVEGFKTVVLDPHDE